MPFYGGPAPRNYRDEAHAELMQVPKALLGGYVWRIGSDVRHEIVKQTMSEREIYRATDGPLSLFGIRVEWGEPGEFRLVPEENTMGIRPVPLPVPPPRRVMQGVRPDGDPPTRRVRPEATGPTQRLACPHCPAPWQPEGAIYCIECGGKLP